MHKENDLFKKIILMIKMCIKVCIKIQCKKKNSLKAKPILSFSHFLVHTFSCIIWICVQTVKIRLTGFNLISILKYRPINFTTKFFVKRDR